MIKTVKHALHYLFIPSEKNNYRAKLIQHDLLSIYLCIILLFTVAIRQGNHLGRAGQILGVATDITTDKLLLYTNEERTKSNLAPLSLNEKLSIAAEKKAENMFTENYWAHFAPDGKTPWDFINQANYHYEFAGENLAKNFLFSKNVVDAWMNSPTHRENLLRPEFSEVGYAVRTGVLNGEETTLVVQMFGKPAVGEAIAQQPMQPQVAQQPVQAQEAGKVLSEVKRYPNTPVIPAFSIVYMFLGVLVMVFAIDFYVATRLKVIRLHGNSLAHMMFLLLIGVGVVFFLTKGAIL
ncbi:hypothetical protein HYS00_01400 [Candidatus Microgenomates bacterium]|nr:hypothetical protein [Candidatus Microgenomates bacterium]